MYITINYFRLKIGGWRTPAVTRGIVGAGESLSVLLGFSEIGGETIPSFEFNGGGSC